MKKNTLLADAMLLLAAVIWGSAFVVLKNTLSSVGPVWTIALRFSLSSLGAWLLFGRQVKGLSRSQWKRCLWVGVLLFLAFLFQTQGLSYTTPGKNAFLTTFYVVLVPFIHWLWQKKKPRRAQLFAAVLAVAGIYLISVSGDAAAGLGDALSVLGGLFFALHIVSVDWAQREADTKAVITIQFTVAAALGLLLAPFVEATPFPLSPSALGGLLYLGIMSSLAAFSLQNFGQKYAPPAHAALLLSLESVFGCLASFFWLKEVFTRRMILGCALMLGAVLISEWRSNALSPKGKSV